MDNIIISCEYGYGGVHEVIQIDRKRLRSRIWGSDSTIHEIRWKRTPVFQKNDKGEITLRDGEGYYYNTYESGNVKDSLRTGVWEVFNNENEKELKTYLEGDLNGSYQKYSANNVLLEEGFLSKGVEVGRWNYYYSNGKKREEVEKTRFGGEVLINSWSPTGQKMVSNGMGIQYFYTDKGVLFSESRFKYKNGMIKRVLKWKSPAY